MGSRIRLACCLAALLLAQISAEAWAQNSPSGAAPWSQNQATQQFAITPSDSTVISPPTQAIYNGAAAACSLSVLAFGDSSAVVLSNVQPGELLPIRATKVMAATTCTNVVGWR